METRLLIPIIHPPKWETHSRSLPWETRILEGERGPILRLKKPQKKKTDILEIEIPQEEIPEWKITPCLIRIPNHTTLTVAFTQRDKSIEFSLDLSAPESGFLKEEKVGKFKMTPKGLEHAIGLRSCLTMATIQTCELLVQATDPNKSFDSSIEKFENIFAECRAEKTTWKIKSEEFNPREEIAHWPKQYLQEWLQMLSRTRKLEANEKDIELLEQNNHKWSFLAEDDPSNPPKQKENYTIVEAPEERILFGRKTILLASIEHRPEEVLHFLEGSSHFQAIQKTNKKDPVAQFINEWTTQIFPLKGMLLPIFQP